MTITYHESSSTNGVQFQNDSLKVFGMENFGNTCYCNSILQCLFYSENFRKKLLNYNYTQHDRKFDVPGAKPHSFTTKYELLLEQKKKEQQKDRQSSSSSNENSKLRKSSIFGINFKSNNTTANIPEEKKMSNYVTTADKCKSLTLDQKIKISKNPDFKNLPIFISRPGKSVKEAIGNEVDKIDEKVDSLNYSQSSTMLLSGDLTKSTKSEAHPTSPSSSVIIVGIPNPEPSLIEPVNPFNLNPSSDQRKRSALINGPIINLDSSLHSSDVNEDSVLLYAMKDMFESMIENKSIIGVVSPSYFVNKLKDKNYLFRQNNMHHDAHEFFNYLINDIIEFINKDLGIENNWCNDIFQGMITNETKCLNCETITSKNEMFLDLSVDIPPGDCAHSLTNSLSYFSKSEILTNQNKFHCNNCSSLQEAVKTIKIKKLPQVLVINFKRFKYDEKVNKLIKLFESISYPFKLRLFNTTEDQNEFNLYELYGLVVHIGGGPTYGHYVSLCKVKPGLWLLFDDETVELVEDNYVMRFFGNGPGLASAYILFYNKIKRANDDELDYNFNKSDLFNGNDYFDVDIADVISNNTNKEEEHSQYLESENASLQSTEIMKKGLLKSFKFDTGSSNKNVHNNINTINHINNQKTNSIHNINTDSGSHVNNIGTTNNNTHSTTSNNTVAPTEKDTKKTWVGGLMRRDSVQSLEKKSKDNVEKRKSFFGFMKKDKKET